MTLLLIFTQNLAIKELASRLSENQ